MRTISLYLTVLCGVIFSPLYGQRSVKYSSVNPAMTIYSSNDVFLACPTKYKNGENIIKPNPSLYPVEGRLENGMPNVIVSPEGNVSIYVSSFLVYAHTPPSKVGAMVYTNSS
mgnify:FL=1